LGTSHLAPGIGCLERQEKIFFVSFFAIITGISRLAPRSGCLKRKEKKTFSLFSDHNGRLQRRQPVALPENRYISSKGVGQDSGWGTCFESQPSGSKNWLPESR